LEDQQPTLNVEPIEAPASVVTKMRNGVRNWARDFWRDVTETKSESRARSKPVVRDTEYWIRFLFYVCVGLILLGIASAVRQYDIHSILWR
jgi:hypothetical protein